MTSPILFVGNSPNQVHGAGKSWRELLSALRGFAGMDLDDKVHELKPFPLHFEEIRNRYLGANPTGSDSTVIKKVAGLFRDMTPNDIHKRLMELPFSDVLTTNYDDCLERSTGVKVNPANF